MAFVEKRAAHKKTINIFLLQWNACPVNFVYKQYEIKARHLNLKSFQTNDKKKTNNISGQIRALNSSQSSFLSRQLSREKTAVPN